MEAHMEIQAQEHAQNHVMRRPVSPCPCQPEDLACWYTLRFCRTSACTSPVLWQYSKISKCGACRWLSSADVLQLDLPLNEAWVPSSEPTCVPGVTPQTLSTHIARQLGAFLTTRFRVSSWTGYLLDASWHKVMPWRLKFYLSQLHWSAHHQMFAHSIWLYDSTP